MPGNREDPVWAVFLTCVLSHLPMVPTIILLYRRRLPYECVNGIFAVFVSFMYHACEAFGTTAYLRALQWHRLDNIGAIGSIVITCMHLACFEKSNTTDFAKYGSAIIITVLQEGYPWDVTFTIVPVALGALVPIVSLTLHPRRRRGIIFRRLAYSGALFLVAILFFVLGLDDKNDPFRMFHGLFHCFVAASMFATWTAIRPTHKDAVRSASPAQKPLDSNTDEYAVVFSA